MAGICGKFNCLKCKKTCRKENSLCTKCKEREKSIDIIKNSKLVEILCKICGEIEFRKDYKIKQLKRQGGTTCDKCLSKSASERFKKYKNSLTKEEKAKQTKMANDARTPEIRSQGVRNQWDTIKASPELYAKSCKRLGDMSRNFWKNATDEERTAQIKACFGGVKSRSKGCEEMKQKMIENNLYEGFISEEVFHGFIPDEINHNLKLIVEYYGDIYHCNPRRFKDENYFSNAIKRTVGEQWKRDRKRLAVFYRYGYTVVVVWESDFQKDSKLQIERIKDAIEKQKKSLGII